MKYQSRNMLKLCAVVFMVCMLFIPHGAMAAKKFAIGLASREIVNDYNRGIIEGAKKVIEAAGGELIVADGQTDIRKHIDNISNLITRGVNGLIVQLGDPEQLASVFQKAQKAGIPVITTTIGQTTPGALCDVNGDDELMTVILARQLLTDIKAQGKVYIISVPGAPVLETRVRIMSAVLKGYNGVKLAEVAPTQHSVPYTLNVMQNILTANPNPGDIAAVFVTYDLIGSGAVQAIKNAGRAKDIKVYAIDGDEIGFQMLFDKNGPFYATVSQNVKQIGEIAAEMVLKAINGKAGEIPYAAYPEMSLVSKTNMEVAIKAAKTKWGDDCLTRWNLDEKSLLQK
jgi:ribose transport system substrate-binding protein